MSFMCQKDSYKATFSTKVVSCTPAKLKLTKKEELEGYNVILEDTILFPEGGGQPDDRGKLNDVDVLRITRKGADAIHFVTTPLQPGTDVIQTLDWVRRFDHMQQHSGQHLVTAIAESLYGWATTSWDLGKEVSFIELDTPKIPPERQEELENEVNEAIRKCLPMTPRWVETGSEDLGQVRTRGLPDDHVGLVRIVEIEGIEANMCCGTHVKNLSHLQAIKLLHAEKGKKNKTNLYFVAGNRVLRYLSKCYNNEKKLTTILKCGPDEHVEAAERQQKALKAAQKNNTMLLRDLAVLEAFHYKYNPDKTPFLCLHRKDGDSEFLNIVANEIGSESVLTLLTAGEDQGNGLFLVSGPSGIVQKAGPRIAEVLGGKGFCKNGRYQGKATRLSQRSQAESILQEYLDELQSDLKEAES